MKTRAALEAWMNSVFKNYCDIDMKLFESATEDELNSIFEIRLHDHMPASQIEFLKSNPDINSVSEAELKRHYLDCIECMTWRGFLYCDSFSYSPVSVQCFMTWMNSIKEFRERWDSPMQFVEEVMNMSTDK